MRYFPLLILILSGCAWWQAGISDPEIVGSAVHNATVYRELASATGIPYAQWVAGAMAVFMTILFKGKKKGD